jgi:hypothetical protein
LARPRLPYALATSGGAERPLEGEIGFLELVLVRTAGGDGEMNTAHAGAHAGAELEQLEADGCDRGIGKLGIVQRDATHCIDQGVSDRCKP